jgi:predicted AlkP superfamily phosphohydrolase/phosphomutase
VDTLLDEKAYLADFNAALDANEAQLDWLMGRNDWDQLMLVAQSTDQASHMFFDEAAVSMRAGGAGAIDASHPLVGVYQRVDRIVGKLAAAAAARKCRLVVMSDHGFAPYRRAVNLNTFLARKGWLALQDRTRWDPPEAGAVLSGFVWGNVDWFNTRAYAIGLGGIYLNVAGREKEGIVKQNGEYEFIQSRLITALLEWRDPKTGQPVFANVYRAQDIYEGPHAGSGPDLVLGFNEGYRVSSASAVGGIPQEPITDNTGHWLADHCGIDAPLIPGICFTNFSVDWPGQVAIGSLAARIWPQAGTVAS